MTYETILLERPEPGIWLLTINRPKSLNALSPQVLYEVADLATATGVQQVFARAQQLDVFPEVLANNAGVGMYGEFADQDLASIRSMLQLDLISLTELTHLFAAQMRAGNGGRILLVGSMAAYQPVPMMAAYGAAKAYVLSFGEALAAELAPQINVCVLSPGIMETGFGSVSGYKHPDSLRPMILKASKVAQIGLDALFAGRSGVIAGRLNGLMALVSRLLPRRFSAQTTVRMERKTQR